MFDIDHLFESGEINDYFYTKLKKSFNFNVLPNDLKEDYISDVINMSKLGVSSLMDEKRYFVTLNCTEDVLTDILRKTPNQGLVAAVSSLVFENRSTKSIDTCEDLFQAVSSALDLLDIPFEKTAYPNNTNNMYIAPRVDMNKWMKATRDIYLKAKDVGFNDAVELVIQNWDKMEKNNYTRWLKIYRENVPAKYKTAQFKYYESPENGFFVPNPISFDDLKGSLPQQDKNFIIEKKPEPDVNDVRTKIEDQRHKIISRLNSAEKLLASLEGQFFAGDDQELMLKLLQDLKRKVQIANKITINSSLFEDYIYRTANYLLNYGKVKPGNFFLKIAQEPDGLSDDLFSNIGETNSEQTDETSELPSLTNSDISPAKQQTQQALKEFFEGLESGISGDPNDTVEERRANKNAAFDADIIVEAQDIPIGEAEPPLPKPRTNPSLEQKHDLIPISPSQQPVAQQPTANQQLEPLAEQEQVEETILPEDNTDDVIDQALSNISVQDLVKRLEMLVSIYNKREISRQINILDIMMDKLGLASYFPALGEAQQKALEANQYIASRLGDILTKVKASIESPKANEWADVPKEQNPETENVQNNLKQQQEEEASLKEKRKAKEKERLSQPKEEEKPVPTGELEGNIPVQQPTQAPVR